MEPLMSMDETGVHLLDDRLMNKLERKKLSPSLINALVDKCHASWLAQSFVLPEYIEEPEDNPRTRGQVFHSVMERFFGYDPVERTKSGIRRAVQETLEEDNYAFAREGEPYEWLTRTVNGYWKLVKTNAEIENAPHEVVLAEVELEGRKRSGLELFVTAHLGDAERDTLGFIDRLVMAEDGSVIVQDWKTGAKIKRYTGGPKSQGVDEKRQQFIYGLLLRELGFEVHTVQLIFPAAFSQPPRGSNEEPVHEPGVLTFNLDSEPRFIKRVLEDVETADSMLSDIITSNTATYKPGILCAWCPLAKLCPAKQVNIDNAKVMKSYMSQPDADDLLRGIELNTRSGANR